MLIPNVNIPISLVYVFITCVFVPLFLPFNSTLAKASKNKKNMYFGFGVPIGTALYFLCAFIIHDAAVNDKIYWLQAKIYMLMLFIVIAHVMILGILYLCFPSKCKIPPEHVALKYSLVEGVVNMCIFLVFYLYRWK